MSSGIIDLLLYLEPSRVWEPALEDTDHEAELRRQQALSAAVDFPALLRSAQGYDVSDFWVPAVRRTPTQSKQTRKTGKVICATSDALPSPLGFFLAEFPHKGHRPSRTLHGRNIRPSPHEVSIKGDGLPVISLQLQLEGNKQPTVRVRRKRRRKVVDRTSHL